MKAVEGQAIGTVYLLERASDGAQVSVEVAGRGVGASVHAVGTVVTCSVIGTGVILSVAGEALAFCAPMPWAVPCCTTNACNDEGAPEHVCGLPFRAARYGKGDDALAAGGAAAWPCLAWSGPRLVGRVAWAVATALMIADPCLMRVDARRKSPCRPRWWSAAWRWRRRPRRRWTPSTRSGAKVVLIGRAGQDLGKVRPALFAPGLGLQNARRPVARDAQAQRLRHGPGSCVPAGPGRVFLDDLWRFEAVVAVPSAAVQAQLWPVLADNARAKALHTPHHSMVSYVGAEVPAVQPMGD